MRGTDTNIQQQPRVNEEEAINSLISLGFERERVIQALETSDYQVERAAAILLDG